MSPVPARADGAIVVTAPSPLPGGGSACPCAAAQRMDPGRCRVGKYQQGAALLSHGDGLVLGAARQGHRFEAAATPVAPSAWAQAERGGQEGCLLG